MSASAHRLTAHRIHSAASRRVRAAAELIGREVVANGICASTLLSPPARARLLRLYGLDLENCHISAQCWLGGSNISIGRLTYVNRGCVFDNTARIVIGAECNIGMGVHFITSDHVIGGHARRAGVLTGGPIKIGDGVWIGTGALILPGTEIGAGAIVAAGAVVADAVPADCLVAGVPARRKRALETT